MAGENHRAAVPGTQETQGGSLLSPAGVVDQLALREADCPILTATSTDAKLGSMVALQVDLPNTAASYDFTLADHGLRISGWLAYKTNGTGVGSTPTLQLTNGTGANDITDAISMAVIDGGAIVGPGTTHISLLDNFRTIAKGGILRMTTVAGGGNCACTVTVFGFPVD